MTDENEYFFQGYVIRNSEDEVVGYGVYIVKGGFVVNSVRGSAPEEALQKAKDLVESGKVERAVG